MCGIAGLLGAGGTDQLARQARAMADRLVHRGPDDDGVWADGDAGVAFGFRRLAILDLSRAGAQPMESASGRYVVVYNGEIYNHHDLRAGLDGPWRGTSDTETLTAALDRWGVDRTLARLNGMFAIAVWDRQNRRLSLARDRFGEKPLYYGLAAGRLLFGSELKALAADPAWSPSIDRGSLAQFLRLGYVPAPRSIFEGIAKLPPGSVLHVNAPERTLDSLPDPVSYWPARDIAAAARPFDGDPEAALDALDWVLRDSVRRRLESDVPLGAFLSGGIDSSLVAALMQEAGTQVRSFTIAFDDPRYDEAPHARAVADHLGTDHTEVPVGEREALDLVPHLPAVYDEPFADVSQIPTLLLCRITRKHVTVALSGDGADELFGGYPRYADLADRWHRLRAVPAPLRAGTGLLARSLPRHPLNRLGHAAHRIAPHKRQSRPGDKLARSLASAGLGSIELLARERVAHWHAPQVPPVIDAGEPLTLHGRPAELPGLPDPLDRLMYLDSQVYLPDDLLVKVDRASMAQSLEVRAPFLDHRVAELAWTLPSDLKIRRGPDGGFLGKWALRQLLYRRVPEALVDRPKQGFEPPLRHWLRGPLCDWADDLLSPDRLRARGLLDPAPIAERWQEHRQDRRDWHFALWDVLMFEAWYDRWMTDRLEPSRAA